jgi:ribulose-phosphate 3-epimerase
MTVNPGFGHQRFLYSTLHKVRRTREMIDRLNPSCALEVDGGVNTTTAPLAVAAGADVLVAGSAIFNDGDSIPAAVHRLREALSSNATSCEADPAPAADARRATNGGLRVDKG